MALNETRHDAESDSAELPRERPFQRQMLYPNEYAWFLLVASLDILLTWVILSHGGEEVNPIAAVVIDRWGLNGAIVFKFSLVLFVIIVCEIVGRTRSLRRGRRLIIFGIGISALPIIWSFFLLYTGKPHLANDEPPHPVLMELVPG